MTPLRLILSLARRARFRSLSSRRMGPAYVALALLTLPAGVLVAHRAGAQQDPVPDATTLRTRRTGALTMPLSVDWKFTSVFVPNNPAVPIVTNDAIYFAAGNRLYAVAPDTGAQKWRYPTGEALLQSQIMGTPTLDKGVLYFSTGEGLYAVNATTGKQVWQPYLIKGGISTSPVAIDNGVYFASQLGQFYAVNAKTGETLEGTYSQATRTGGIQTGGDVSGDLSVVDNIAYYVTANNQALHAVDLTTGIQKWAIRLQADVHNTIPIPNGDTITMVAGNLLLSLRSASGAIRWSRVLDSEAVVSPVVDSEGNAYIITTERKIYALDSRNKPLWQQAPVLDYEPITAPIIANNMLIVGTTGGGLAAFDIVTGAPKWNYTISPSSTNPNNIPPSTTVSAKPVVFGNTLYALTDDGTLTAFRHDAIDMLPPIITPLLPEQGDYLNGRPPFEIAARVQDEGSGLNLNTLALKLDDKPIQRRIPTDNDDIGTKPGYVYNPDDGSVVYSTVENETGRTSALTDGHHSVTLSVQDWKGNLATKTWSFTIDDTIPQRVRRAPTSIVPRQTPPRGGVGFPGGGFPGGRPGGGGGGGRPGGGGGGGRPGGGGGGRGGRGG